MKVYHLKPPTDFHGNPLPFFKSVYGNEHDKAVDQLIGACAGILSDGVVNEKEAIYFNQWVRTHSPLEPAWPFTDIIARLDRIFTDGVCDAEEREELRIVMAALCGIRTEEENVPKEKYSTTLPLDNPAPIIVFAGKRFHVTGQFAFGSRTKVMEVITSRGGEAYDSTPNRETDYLVVGIFASEKWATASFGRKIQRAIELRESGSGIAIVSEEHWRKFLC